MRLLLRIVCLAGALLAALPCHAAVAVKGYTRKDGTYVAPHYRSATNSTKNDNYSTKGNVNPYTGKEGTKPGDAGSSSSAVAPTSASSTTAKSSPAPEAAREKAPPVSPWSKLHVGMTKAEVTAVLGTPNMQTAKKWVYHDTGVVTFDDKGKLDGISTPK
jgi:hypothetical protein